MVATCELQCCELMEDILCNLRTGQHACARTTYVSCLRRERGLDSETWILDMVETCELQFRIGGQSLCDLYTGQYACARKTYVSCLRGERDLYW